MSGYNRKGIWSGYRFKIGTRGLGHLKISVLVLQHCMQYLTIFRIKGVLLFPNLGFKCVYFRKAMIERFHFRHLIQIIGNKFGKKSGILKRYAFRNHSPI